MGNIKQDVKESVKVFTLTFVSYVVKESTKKLIKSLTQIQRKMLESKVKNMSDDQLEQYFDKDPYFKSELENTVKSVNHIHPTHRSGSWLENLQMDCESSCIQNLIKALIQPVTRVAFAVIACIALMSMIAVLAVIAHPDNVLEPLVPNSSEEEIGPVTREQTPASDPVANFSTNVTRGYTPLSVQFIDLSENATSREWNFGDGNSSTEKDPVHTYSVAGNYTVSLSATNENGNNSTSVMITVQGPPVPPLVPVLPFARFISSTTRGYAPLSIKFTDQSENATGWKWDFGDGINSTDQNPTHRYSSAGKYTVNLTVANANGIDSTFATITVLKKPVIISGELVLPFANFIGNVTRGYVPLSVQFTDQSENATEWKWNFGDGNTSTEKNTTHTYSAAGKYSVNLTVTNENGADSMSAIIAVLEPPVLPAANFSSNVTSGNAPLTVSFTDRSTGNPTVWKWDFGDGNTSTGKSPVHTFYKEGTYTVNLTVSNSNSTDSKNGPINVTPAVSPISIILPVANFSSNVTQGYPSLSVQFTDQSENATSRSWNFGDGTSSTEQSPVHTYSAAGNYTVRLTVNNEDGTDSKTATITVLQHPGYVYVTNSDDNTVSVIDIATKRITDTISVGINPEGIAAVSDEVVYVANSGDESDNSSSISIIDTASKIVIETLNIGGNGGLAGVAVNPTGTTVYVTNAWEDTVSVIDTATREVTDIIDVDYYPERIAVTPDGTKAYVANSGYGTISVIDTGTDNVIDTVYVGTSEMSYLGGVAVAPDGKKVYVAVYGDGVISIIDTDTNTVTDNTVYLGEESDPWGIAVTPDGTKVYVANSGYGTISVIDANTDNVIDSVLLGEESYPSAVAVTLDGKEVYVVNSGRGTISVIDTTTNNVSATVDVGGNPVEVAIIKG